MIKKQVKNQLAKNMNTSLFHSNTNLKGLNTTGKDPKGPQRNTFSHLRNTNSTTTKKNLANIKPYEI